MVVVKIMDKPKFGLIGVKTWISGTDNSQFAEFWKRQSENGNIDKLRSFAQKADNAIGAHYIGLSDTTADPNKREFNFFIAVEADNAIPAKNPDFEKLPVKAYTWAVFSEGINSVESLIACEMQCWKEWLPNNGKYEHDNGPEMEVYFPDRIEYWIPIREKRP